MATRRKPATTTLSDPRPSRNDSQENDMWQWLTNRWQNKEVNCLREEVRLLRHEQEARTTANSSNIPLRENFPNGWSPNYPGFETAINPAQAYYDGLTPLFAPIPSLWDYTLNLGFYVTQAWCDVLDMSARYWFATNPTAQGVIKGLSDYVIGEGFTYQVQPKPGQRVNQELLKGLQSWLDELWEKNDGFAREKGDYYRIHRDGNKYDRIFLQEDDIPLIRTVEPWQVRSPGKTDPEYLFGIHTDPDDRETTIGYCVSYTGNTNDNEEVPVAEMSLLKIGTDREVKRGISDFLATQALLQDCQKLLTTTVKGEQVRQALAWIEQTQGASQLAAQQYLQQIATNYPGETSPLNAVGQTNIQPTQRFEPGQIPRLSEGLEMKPGPVGNTPNANVILQAAYQALSVYFRVPEWMVAGTSDANFAQALVQESPLVRSATAEQKFLKGHYAKLIKKAMKLAEMAGRFPPGTTERIHINVEAPPLVVRDPAKETVRMQALYVNGVISKKTWTTKEGLDWETEQENIREEKAKGLTPEFMGKGTAPIMDESTSPKAEYARQTDRSSLNGAN